MKRELGRRVYSNIVDDSWGSSGPPPPPPPPGRDEDSQCWQTGATRIKPLSRPIQSGPRAETLALALAL
eukprot:3405150-Pyramimonas_sp.AAC.1